MNLAKHFARMGLGSGRVSRLGFGVAPKQSFLWTSLVLGAKKPQEKFAIARTQSPTRETRALPVLPLQRFNASALQRIHE